MRGQIRRFEPDFDLSRTADVQAHITVLGPFVPLEDCDGGLVAELAAFFLAQPSFSYTLREVCTFPGVVVYLSPEPQSAFCSLIDATAKQYPSYPPYGGQFDEVIPHMTVGPLWSVQMEDRLIQAATEAVPIHSVAREVRLIYNAPKRFETIAVFPLSDVKESAVPRPVKSR